MIPAAPKQVSLAGKLHAHGCSNCNARLEDNCTTPTVDPWCFTCRSGLPASLTTRNRFPQPCCMAHSREANKSDRAVYKLAGIRTWFICTLCKRTHPTRPKRTLNG